MNKSSKSPKSSKAPRLSRFSYSEITSVLKSLVGGPRVTNKRFTYYTDKTGLVLRSKAGIKILPAVYKLAKEATTPQAKELVETANLIWSDPEAAKTKFSTKKAPKAPKSKPATAPKAPKADLVPLDFSFTDAKNCMIAILGGARVEASTFAAITNTKGGTDNVSIVHYHKAKTARGKSGLRLRIDAYQTASAAADAGNSEAIALLEVANLIWNTPDLAKAKYFVAQPAPTTPVETVATV